MEPLRMILPPGQCFAVSGPDGVTLVDCGPPGSADAVLDAVDGTVVRIVLTHHHGDHAGSAAELRTRTGAEVVAHERDAPVIRGDVAPTEPSLVPAEAELYEQVRWLLAAPPCPVDREVRDGDVLPGGLHVVHTPGHTAGSIALHLPDHRILFTGDTVAENLGSVVMGPFPVDRAQSLAWFHRLVAFDVDRAFVGHGEPIDAAGLRGAVPGPFA